MRFKCCTASLKTLALGIALIAAISGGEVWASALSMGVRVQTEFFTPLVPSVKKVKTCFKIDSSGTTVMGFCTDTSPDGNRMPAANAPKAPARQNTGTFTLPPTKPTNR